MYIQQTERLLGVWPRAWCWGHGEGTYHGRALMDTQLGGELSKSRVGVKRDLCTPGC